MTQCSIEGCDGYAITRTWCKKHYTRWQRYGDPIGKPQSHVLEWVKKCVESNTDECLIWPYEHKSKNPYAMMSVGGRTMNVHRRILMLTKGDPVSPKWSACHTCGNKLCHNPRHLYWGTQSDNMKDYHYGSISDPS